MNAYSEEGAMSLEKPDGDLMENRLRAVEGELEIIRLRNRRVEADKAWETSLTRFFTVTLITYLTMNLILWTIGGPFPPIHALVPTAGYVLSTLSLPKVKQWWIRRRTEGRMDQISRVDGD